MPGEWHRRGMLAWVFSCQRTEVEESPGSGPHTVLSRLGSGLIVCTWIFVKLCLGLVRAKEFQDFLSGRHSHAVDPREK